jgi:hypothetical protein
MKTPFISRAAANSRSRQRGVTMALVALAMVAIVAMAALSIDVITLYLAREEAQRSVDAAAIAAAKIISVSGITGDPQNLTGNWLQICGPDDGVNGLATRVAKAVVAQNAIGSLASATPTVTYSAGTAGAITSSSDCRTLATTTAFGVNPMVTVTMTQTGLPTFFSRIWGYSGQQVSATAVAEAFNSSNSGNAGNQETGSVIPVNPRCAKPWIVPNLDPQNPTNPPGCTNNCKPFVSTIDGSIQNQGISLGGTGTSGSVGESFWLVPDCAPGGNCTLLGGGTQQPVANFSTTTYPGPFNLLYVPNQVGTPVIGVPSCSTGAPYEQAIEGCDQPTNYSCGVQAPSGGNIADLTLSPAVPTTTGVSCLIHQGDTGTTNAPSGQDYLNPFGAPATFPFQILAGSSNPLLSAGITSGSPVSVSPSLVTLPIYDSSAPTQLQSNRQNPVTFVGFLEVFINAVDVNGDIYVTVVNIAGCSNGSPSNPDPVSSSPVIGNSAVPVRLITNP